MMLFLGRGFSRKLLKGGWKNDFLSNLFGFKMRLLGSFSSRLLIGIKWAI